MAFRVRAHERVDGLTGVVVTTKLGRAVVREEIPMEGEPPLTPGEPLYVLRYVGEGFWKAWARGHLYDADIPAKDQTCQNERGAPVACAVQITEEPETVWWAKVRNAAGLEGWTRDLAHFGGIDACGTD